MSDSFGIQSLYWLDVHNEEAPFPPVDLALRDPDGLLAFGGSLGSKRLLRAYRLGIFPWYSEGQPIMWWSPDPRTVLYPDELRVSRSLRKSLRNAGYTVSIDRCFEDVIDACAAPRDDEGGTWITRAMRDAYVRLHHEGHAHSVETWYEGELVGGLYGIAIGCVFFGESMFSRRRDASKVAFTRLTRQLERWGFTLIDCQVHSAHLSSLGARAIPRHEFITELDKWCEKQPHMHTWQFDESA